MLRRNVCQRNVLLQERRRRSAGNAANFAASVIEYSIAVTRDAALYHLEPNQRPGDARGSGHFQRCASDKIRFLRLAETIEPGFPNVDGVGNFVTVERQAAFQAKSVARAQAAGDRAEFLSRCQNFAPDSLAGHFVGRNVNLEAIFRRIARASDQDFGQSAHYPARDPVEPHRTEVFIGQLLKKIDRLGPLDGDLGEIVGEMLYAALELAGVVAHPVESFSRVPALITSK